MDSNMVEENGNSSLDPMSGESASGHNNTDDNSTHQSQQSQLSSMHHQQQQQQQQHPQQDASPSRAILATSANIVQFIPNQSVQVSLLNSHQSLASCLGVCVRLFFFFLSFWFVWLYELLFMDIDCID